MIEPNATMVAGMVTVCEWIGGARGRSIDLQKALS